MTQRRRLAIALFAACALGAFVVGVVVGAGGDESPGPAPPTVAERTGRSLERTSFLARIVPLAERRERAASGPNVPRNVADLARRLPLERQVAQLFLLGFQGTDLNAEIFRRLRRLDLGGLVVESANYRAPALLGQMGGEAIVISRQEKHIPPWVLTLQDGGEFNSLSGLPPARAPADTASAADAERMATQTATTLRGLNVTGVLGPVADVGFESGSALGARIYSDDPDEVSGYVDAIITAYRAKRLFGAVRHFPGLGTADQSTELGPASVGLDLDELRQRDLLPFQAAVEAGVPGVVLSHALYPMSDFTVPASLSPAIATDLLRKELHFAGVAITDDLADPAITATYSVPDAAVRALAAGADLVWISGPAADQEAAYAAVLRAARSGRLPRRRITEALLRALKVKEGYGLIR